MFDTKSLLPPNATRTERAIEQATARLATMPATARHTWNPQTCPIDLLPWLAWALSVDEWDSAWPERTKRAAIAASIGVHKHKGTRSAINRIMSALDASVRITEWWQNQGTPHTFGIDIYVSDNLTQSDQVISAQLYRQLNKLIDANKPVRSHYELRVGARFNFALRAASAARTATVGRWSNNPIAVQPTPAIGRLRVASAVNPMALLRLSMEAR